MSLVSRAEDLVMWSSFFAFIMFLAGGGSIVLGIPAVIGLAKTIRDDDRNAQATPSA